MAERAVEVSGGEVEEGYFEKDWASRKDARGQYGIKGELS